MELKGAGTRTLVTGGSGFIGTHLVDRLLESGRSVLAVSRSLPRKAAHASVSRPLDVLDLAGLKRTLRDFVPHEIVHLAARADFVERDDRGGWEINTRGTANVLTAAAEAGVERCIFASSYVFDGAAEPADALRFDYLASKREAERIVRAHGATAPAWCIVRPCATWGPGFGAPFRQFFLAIAGRRYFHLGSADPPKQLGYVGNVASQIVRLLDAPLDRIRGRTLYLGDDEPTTLRTWATLIAGRLGRRPPRTLPEPLVQLAVGAGDLLVKVGYRQVPLTSARLRHMRTDTSRVPIAATREIVGPQPYTLADGVDRTLGWMREEGLL